MLGKARYLTPECVGVSAGLHLLRIFNTKVLVGTSRFRSAWYKQDIQHQSACWFKQGFMVVQVKRGAVGLSHKSKNTKL